MSSFFSNPGKYLREALQAQRERQRQRAHDRRAARRQRRQQQNNDNVPDQADLSSTTQSVDNNYIKLASASTTHKSSLSSIFPSVFTSKDFEDIEFLETRKDDSTGLNLTPFSESLPDTDGYVNFVNPFEDVKDNSGTAIAIDGDSRGLRHKISVIDLPFGLPEDIPSEPVSTDEKSCCGPFACYRYQVSYKLRKNYYRQSLFLKRVMIFLQVQLMILQLLTLIVKFVPGIAGFFTDDNFDYCYIPLVFFFLSKIALRSMACIRKIEHKIILHIIAIIRTLCLAYYCTAITIDAETDIIFLIEFQLSCTIVFFILTSNFVDYDVANSEIVGMAVLVNLFNSLIVFIMFLIVNIDTVDFGNICNITVANYVPSFIASEIIITILMFDLKQIMNGWRFPLGEADWLYTCLYL